MTLTRSTPLQRTAFARAIPTEAHFAAKPRTCKHCRSKFTPVRAGQVVHLDCAVPYVQAQNAKKREAAKKADRKVTREKLAKLHPLSWHKKQAQAAVNAYVRARDAHLPCISCGRMHEGAWDAGHYRTRGSAPHLALDPRNVHRQCVPCNQHLHGNVVEFRKGLVKRFGVEFVEALEADQSTKKYNSAEFDGIAAHYRAELRALQKEMA